jgi:hypothetical protein
MKACIALVTVCLIVSLSLLALPVKAQDPLNLTIKPDGSIEPSTDLLERTGSTYIFKGDIFGTITVRKAGITIDGTGHTLQGNRHEANIRGINLVGHDETFNAYSNVLIKNLRIKDFTEGIYTPTNNNTFTGNFFDNARIHMIGGSDRANLIKHNNFNRTVIFVDYNRGGDDVITENNFFDSWIFVDLAEPPIVYKNYWSNYTTKYPNATEAGNSGIWDMPYETAYNYGGKLEYFTDDHPLVKWVSSEWLPDSYIMSFEEAIESVSKQDFDLWEIGSGGQTGNLSQTGFVSESGITGYLMWLAPNGNYFEAEYPSGKVLGEIGYLRGNNSLNLPPEGYYVWRLNYGDGEAYWGLGHNRTIVRAYPLRGSGPVPPPTPGLMGFAVAAAVIIVIVGLGLLIYLRKRRPKLRDKT